MDDGSGVSPEAAIEAVGEGRSIIFVTAHPDQEEAAIAQRLGADVVRLPSAGANPGRARNAGYRRLKVLNLSLDYVQFVNSSFVLHADWFDEAVDFMNRRSEVAVVDGFVDIEPAATGVIAAIGAFSHANEHGERASCSDNIFVRADAFEAAGGFRGDISANDTADLCIRLRRRGRHVWRADTQMGVAKMRTRKLGDWWRDAKRDGRRYAHGAALHGAAPERYFVLEQARAIIWGGAFPAFIVLCSVFMGLGVYFMSPLVNPVLVAGAVAAVGVFVYTAKVFVIALRHGLFSWTAWRYGAFTTLGHFPEFLGVADYHLNAKPAASAPAS
ncbi:MAG: glycosyltransferase family 2 protein [Pseudomonadota bacterium]